MPAFQALHDPVKSQDLVDHPDKPNSLNKETFSSICTVLFCFVSAKVLPSPTEAGRKARGYDFYFIDGETGFKR